MEKHTLIMLDLDTAAAGSAAQSLEKTLQQLQKTTQAAFSSAAAVKFAKTTTGALNKLQSTLAATKRSLAGFDQIQRLGKKESSSTVSSGSSAPKKGTTQLLLEMLKQDDGVSLQRILHKIAAGISMCNMLIKETADEMGLLQLRIEQQTLLTDLNSNSWYKNLLARNAVANAQKGLNAAIAQYIPAAAQASVSVKALLAAFEMLQAQMQRIHLLFTQIRLDASELTSAWQVLSFQIQNLSKGIKDSLLSLQLSFGNLFSAQMLQRLQQGFAAAYRQMQIGMSLLVTSVEVSFLPQWERAWQNVGSCVRQVMASTPVQAKSIANSVIHIFNRLVQSVSLGFNSLIASINRFRASSGITGLPTLSGICVPQIPQLAKGAVLPANKPFLAMVGDQKHGTNVEAPLATIQEAVMLAMEDLAGSNRAGHEATVQLLQEILNTVSGISIGDDVIAGAVSRYNSRMAVVRGGLL